MKPKVLVIDDIPINLSLISKILSFEELDYEIITGKDGVEACELALQEMPDIILMDWELPKMSGLDAVKYLKNNTHTCDIPIIMVTAYTMPEHVQQAFEAGASDYIKKPVNAVELRARVKSTLQLTRSVKTIRDQNTKIEAQIQELQKLALVAGKTTHSFIIITLDGEIEWSNEGFKKLHGYGMDDCIKMYGTNILDYELYSHFKDAFYDCLKVGKDMNFSTQVKTNTDKEKWLHVSLTPVYNDQNEMEKIIAIETDISELKKKEQELNSKHNKLRMLTRYLGKANSKLERQKEEINGKNEALEKEKQKVDNLLLNILPYEIAYQLKNKGNARPKNYRMVSVLFADFKDFSRSSLTLKPNELVEILDSYFTRFDDIINGHYLEKIKTVGDAYMCAGGLPLRNHSNPIDAVLAGIRIQHFVNEINQIKQSENKPSWELRLGVHTGPVIAGIVGEQKFAYDIWGQTVNIASRMESAGQAGMVNISGSTYEHIKDFFDCEYRGKIEAKNIGKVDMYFVQGLKPAYCINGNRSLPNDEFIRLLNEI
jgi:PAS domain S-box-containing protein